MADAARDNKFVMDVKSGGHKFGFPLYAKPDLAAHLLGMCRATLYTHVNNKNIRMLKLGKRSLVDMRQAVAFIEMLPDASVVKYTDRGCLPPARN